MQFSKFGQKMSGGAGILSLMDDLGNAMAEGDMIMMGGGNPGYIPEIQDVMKQQLQSLINDDLSLRKMIGVYDPPNGEKEFIKVLADMLQEELGWNITSENICLTNGSQCAFFLIFNMLAGEFEGGKKKKILLPMAPEYIGYADLGLTEDFFVSVRPRIELIGDTFFKYRVDFDNIAITEDIGAICVSRPTNPTGNVLTDNEVGGLAELAEKYDIPFILDSAYGVPFPSMIYTDATPMWNENIIVSMSLSKFGLPAVRTGIVIARKEIIKALASVNSVVNLAPGSFGAMLTTELIRSKDILGLSKNIIQPFYRRKMELCLDVIDEAFKGCNCKVHVPEGAMFLWLWFPDLPMTSRELYERLKKRNVLVVSGDYFFPGLEAGWPHTDQCLRVNYSQDEEDVHKGLRLIAEEIKTLT